MKLSPYLASTLLLLAWIIPATPAYSETRYVSDVLIITVREGKGTEHKTITTLKTGAPVEILAHEPPYLKIRTEKDKTGYVKAQYLSKQLPKKEIIRNLKQEKQGLTQKLADLKKKEKDSATRFNQEHEKQAREIEELTALSTSQKKELERNSATLQEVNQKYNELVHRSKRVIETATERDRLKEENGRLTKTLEEIRTQKSNMMTTGMIKWFLAGAGVFFVGWLAGAISRKKKRSSL